MSDIISKNDFQIDQKPARSTFAVFFSTSLAILLFTLGLLGVIYWIMDLDPGGDYYEQQGVLGDINVDYSKYELDENGCFGFEIYDEELDECYAECETDEQCTEIDAIYDGIFSGEGSFNDSDWLNSILDGLGGYGREEEYSEEEILASYDLTNDNLPEKSEIGHKMLWEVFEKMFSSSEHFERVDKFTVFSDGEDGTLAYVSQLDEGYETWELAVDLNDYIVTNSNSEEYKNLTDLRATLIHEYAHVLSLNSDELSDDLSGNNGNDSCPTYNPGEGCLNGDAYLNEYFELFWEGKVIADYNAYTEKCDIESEEECEGLSDFYAEYSDKFVSEYAATNPAEDFAESFASFVLLTDYSKQPLTVEKKLKFFENYPELVELRRDIRREIISLN